MIEIGDLVRITNEALLPGGDQSRRGKNMYWRGRQHILRVLDFEGRVAVLDRIDTRHKSPHFGNYMRIAVRNLTIHRKDRMWAKKQGFRRVAVLAELPEIDLIMTTAPSLGHNEPDVAGCFSVGVDRIQNSLNVQ
jgi:hypothetical protein